MSRKRMNRLFAPFQSTLKLAGPSKEMARHLLVLSLLAVSTGIMAKPDLGFGICTNCSNAGFAYTAEQAAPPEEGSYAVYVNDSLDGEVRYFDVEVSWACEGIDLQSLSPRDAEILAVIGFPANSHCFERDSVPGSGSASIISDMQEAHHAVKEFYSSEHRTVDSEDIQNSSVDSVIELVGPEDSPACLRRAGEANWLSDYFAELWGSITAGLSDMALVFSSGFFASSDYLEPASSFSIDYPDGTRIKGNMTRISAGYDGSISVQVEFLPEMVRLSDGAPVPQLKGHFDEFDHIDDPGIIEAISNLAQMFGIPVNGDSNGSRIACAKGDDGEIACRILPE